MTLLPPTLGQRIEWLLHFVSTVDGVRDETRRKAHLNVRELGELARTNQQNMTDLVDAARGLYERVQMDESIGLCLSERATCLILGDVLSRFPQPEEEVPNG